MEWGNYRKSYIQSLIGTRFPEMEPEWPWYSVDLGEMKHLGQQLECHWRKTQREVNQTCARVPSSSTIFSLDDDNHKNFFFFCWHCISRLSGHWGFPNSKGPQALRIIVWLPIVTSLLSVLLAELLKSAVGCTLVWLITAWWVIEVSSCFFYGIFFNL